MLFLQVGGNSGYKATDCHKLSCCNNTKLSKFLHVMMYLAIKDAQ